MSTDDQFDDDPFGDSEDNPETASVPPPKKQGMSTLVKVLIFLGCSAVGLGVVCCGGMAWWFSTMQPTKDHDEIVAMTKTIIDIQIPDTFEPNQASDVNAFFVAVKTVVYDTASKQGTLVLMSTKMPDAGGPQQQAQQEGQVLQQLRQQGHSRLLTIKSSEPKKFMIRGKEVKFVFSKATESSTNKAYRKVVSSFAGKAGTTMFFLEVPEDKYDEEAIIKMIESIK